MKKNACIVLMFCCLGSFAFAQVEPAATGTTAAPVARGLQYAFRYSETAQFGGGQQTVQASDVSGSVAYESRNLEKPFTMEYVGGYFWTLSGPAYLTGQFQRLDIGQGFDFRRWKFMVSDDVSYLPDAPTTGFSGIPGIGEVIGAQNPTTTTNGQAIQTVSTHVLSNSALGQVEHTLNYATTLTINGNDNLLYFPNNDGIDSRNLSTTANLSRRLNGRTSLSGEYNFQNYQFPDYSVSMQSHTALVGLRHRLTRNLTANATAGPMWISSNVSTLIPNVLTYAVSGSLIYERKLDHFDLSYSRGVSNGSGFLIGAELEDTSGNFLHQIGPNLSIGFTGGYSRTFAFNTNGTTSGAYGAAQATWQVGEKLIVFANYTGRGQSTTSALPGNVLSGMENTLSFGFGLSPRQPRARQ